MRIKDYDGQMIDVPDPVPMARPTPEALQETVYQGILDAMQPLEEHEFDFGPTEYIEVLCKVQVECARRILSRSGGKL